jgi:multiple sugar transport system permease protein
MTDHELKKMIRRRELKENWPNYLMLAPFLITFFLFLVLPVISSIFLSFTDFDMINTPKFIGLDNYMRMLLDDDTFPIVFKNTLIFAVICGPAGFLLSFVLAWFLNEFTPMVRTVLSFLFYAPSLVGGATMIWQVAFSSDAYGYINSALLSLGLITSPVTWLSTEKYIKPIIIIVQLWSSMGVSFLTNISGLQNINQELYEAGAIDGVRNRWQELWYITLPTMKHMLLFSAVMAIQSAFSIGALVVALVGYPSIGYAGDTITSHMSDVGSTRFELGYASAITVVLFLVMSAARLLIGKVLNKTGK